MLKKFQRFDGGITSDVSDFSEVALKVVREQTLSRPASRLSFWDWVHEYWVISGSPFTLENHPHMQAIYADNHAEIIIMKSAQCGASEWAIARSVYQVEAHSQSIIYFFPAGEQLGDHVRQRVDPRLLESPYLASQLRQPNNVGQKRIGSGFVHFRGAQTRRQVISVTADGVVADELDEFGPGVMETLEKRTGAAEVPRLYKLSTPTFPDFGIHAEYATKSDGRKYMQKCPHCDKHYSMTDLDWETNIYMVCEACGSSTPMLDWKEHRVLKSGGYAYNCPDCRHPNYIRKTEKGFWVACPNCFRELDRWAEGKWVPQFKKRSAHGYHINKLMVPTAPLGLLASDLLHARNRQEFYNSDMGLPKVPEGNRLTREDLKRASERDAQYDKAPPHISQPKITFGGIDVGSSLHCQVLGLDDKLYGAREFPLGQETEARQWLQEMRCDGLVIDALPEQRLAKAFVDSFPEGKAYRMFWNTNENAQHDVYIDDKNRALKVKRNGAFEEVYLFVREQLILPNDWREMGKGELGLHYTANIRSIAIDEETGKRTVSFTPAGKPDHYYLALIMAYVARKVISETGLSSFYEVGSEGGPNLSLVEAGIMEGDPIPEKEMKEQQDLLDRLEGLGEGLEQYDDGSNFW